MGDELKGGDSNRAPQVLTGPRSVCRSPFSPPHPGEAPPLPSPEPRIPQLGGKTQAIHIRQLLADAVLLANVSELCLRSEE